MNSRTPLQRVLSRRDFHVHTFLSPCAKDPGWTPEAIAALAEEMNMETVVIADHYHERRPGFFPPPFYSGVDESVYEKNAAEVKNLKTSAEILVSCEIDMIRPGLFTVSEEFAWRLPARLVSASHYHLEGIDRPEGGSPAAVGRCLMERMRAAIEWPPAQILVHPLAALHGSLGELEKVLDTITDDDFRGALSAARRCRTAVELGAGMFDESLPWHEHILRFYSLAREEGCKIAPSSDSHSAQGFGSTGRIFPWAEKLGFRAEDVIDSQWLKSGARAY